MKDYVATRAFEEALDRTIALLWPPKKGIWFRIAIVAIFLGGGMINPFRTDTMQIPGEQTMIPGPELIAQYANLLFTITAGLLIIGLGYVIVSAIFQFIFVDCLSSGKVLLTRTFRLRWQKGLHLVGFYIVLLMIMLICTCAVTLAVMVPVLQSQNPGFIDFLVLLIKILVILLIILVPVWVLAILTADFVVPVMIVDDCGVIRGMKKVCSLFRGRWMEAGIYTLTKILLTVIAGIILGVIIFLLSIPLGIAGAVLTAGTGWIPDMTPGGIILYGSGMGAMFFISLILLVPLITFFRYYSLIVLQDLDPRYTLLSDISGMDLTRAP